MTEPPAKLPSARWTIAGVERETGISKDTLRIWERRYGFPSPERDPIGDRRYSDEQIQRLQRIKRLLDAGHRAGQVVPLDSDALAALDTPLAAAPARAANGRAEVDAWLQMTQRHDVEGLHADMRRLLARHGVQHFVCELAAPFTRAVGDAWARGEIQVFEEHMASDSLSRVLREAVLSMRHVGESTEPRVLMALPPGEQHLLGLQMVEALLTLGGASCTSLGAQAPLRQIALAAKACSARVVCLSFSAAANPHGVASMVNELRAELSGTTALWVGGEGASGLRRPSSEVRVFRSLHDVPTALDLWRRVEQPG